MDTVVPILGTISLFSILPVLLRVGRFIRGTTLNTAWHWAWGCWFLWEIAWTAAWFPLAPAFHDQLWYAVALLGLCPPIAVLGAKRPGSRAWGMFVVLPLLLVFAWPAAVGWVRQFPPERLQFETPMLMGYGLVLLMGYGNYVGTRQTLPSLGCAAALGWLAVLLSQAAQIEEPIRPLGPTLLFAAAGLTAFFGTSRPSSGSGFNRLWNDFQQAFGMVWAKRVQDRLNDTAQREEWAAHLGPEGLIWKPDPTAAEQQKTWERLDHAVRWLLRRFADPHWIDKRLESQATTHDDSSND